MRLWAIKQKSTGFYIPAPKGRAGGSWEEPTKDCIPRLFTKEKSAKAALSAWLQGRWRMESFPSSHESFFDDDCALTIYPDPRRKAEDMQVVPMKVQEEKVREAERRGL